MMEHHQHNEHKHLVVKVLHSKPSLWLTKEGKISGDLPEAKVFHTVKEATDFCLNHTPDVALNFDIIEKPEHEDN